MRYSQFKDLKISKLGFGTMRLPLRADGSVDEETVFTMVDEALAGGVNYFDTAWPYHQGMSETVLGRALAKHDRKTFFVADKYPGHQIAERYEPDRIFERQLEKTGLSYFDFYLLHNVYEKSIDVYTDGQWKIMDYFFEQRKKGRIRHLGFSTHARPDTLRGFIRRYGHEMEFCQIQMNYLDWTLQDARAKYEMLTAAGIPVFVMEPLRGGKLADIRGEDRELMKQMRPNDSCAAWAFRWLEQFDNVAVILSGMSDRRQLSDNLRTFSSGTPLADSEKVFLFSLAEKMKDSLPCTGCRYCTDGCPAGLDIPMLIKLLNELHAGPDATMTPMMQMEALPEDKRPSACLSCGLCARICPQKINIPEAMKELQAVYEKAPKWSDLCRARAFAQK